MTIQQSIPAPPSHQRPSPAADANSRVTPMMEQYLEIKAGHPGLLLFYRMGDFYELFFEDAEIASKTLGIVLTKRGKHQGMDIPMCGVPVERSEDYLHRLINAGHRVAVCEQTENPAAARARGNKSVVRRGVVRLVTPGTLTEDTLLDARTNNYLLAIARARASAGGDRVGLAWIDISTSEFMVTECSTAELAATLARINPNEVIVTDALYGDPDLGPLLRELQAVTPLTRDVFDGATAERRLCDYFAVATMDGLSAMSRLEATAAAAAVTYIDRTQVGKRPPLSPPSREAAGTTMAIDPATRANLELTRARWPANGGDRCSMRSTARLHRRDRGCWRSGSQRRSPTALRLRGGWMRSRRSSRIAAARDDSPHHAQGSARHVARAGAAVGRARRPARPRRAARRHPRRRSGADAPGATGNTAGGNLSRDGSAAPSVARSCSRIRTRARRAIAADQARRRFCSRRL